MWKVFLVMLLGGAVLFGCERGANVPPYIPYHCYEKGVVVGGKTNDPNCRNMDLKNAATWQVYTSLGYNPLPLNPQDASEGDSSE